MMTSEHRTKELRSFFASMICGIGECRDRNIEQAFASMPREQFAGPGPWSIAINGGYIVTPNDDPAFLYQDTLIALDSTQGINIGQPSAHARWLASVNIQRGDSVLQVGAGTGYYTAIISSLVGEEGRVYAYEIHSALAPRAKANLQRWPQSVVETRSGISENLPQVNVVYVCAGVTQPSWTWLDALKTDGRLLFPLQPVGGFGGMLRITRPVNGNRWPAKFISRASFVGAEGLQDPAANGSLAEAFDRRWFEVRSFVIDDDPDESCWYAGDGWWLSYNEIEP